MAGKYRQIQIDGLSIDKRYVIFSNSTDHLIIKNDLKNKKYINFIGFIALAEDPKYPKSNFPENDYISSDNLGNIIDDGVHLVISANIFLTLVNQLGLAKVDSWRNNIHIAKISDWLFDRSGKDIYRNEIPIWAYNQLQEDNSKVGYQILKLFLTIYGPKNLYDEELFTYLANTDICGLQNGLIAPVFTSQSDLKNAWIFYKDAVSEAVTQSCAALPYPMWEGEIFDNKKIVFRRETGPSDEILYANVFNDLLADGIKIIIESDPRLVSLFARSFLEAEVVPRLEPAHSRLLKHDISLQANYTDPYLEYRSKLNSFPDHQGYLKPDERLKLKWKNYLKIQFPENLKIGISWGSQSNSISADKMTTRIEEWSSILKTPKVNFINLQYGNITNDLIWVKNKLGIEISEIPDIDLYNDLDSLAALISNLDLIISVNNINSNLAGATGTPLWEIVPKFWWLLLGQSYSPFYPRSQIFEPNDEGFKRILALLSSPIK
jgi:hypothetical protein